MSDRGGAAKNRGQILRTSVFHEQQNTTNNGSRSPKVPRATVLEIRSPNLSTKRNENRKIQVVPAKKEVKVEDGEREDGEEEEEEEEEEEDATNDGEKNGVGNDGNGVNGLADVKKRHRVSPRMKKLLDQIAEDHPTHTAEQNHGANNKVHPITDETERANEPNKEDPTDNESHQIFKAEYTSEKSGSIQIRGQNEKLPEDGMKPLGAALGPQGLARAAALKKTELGSLEHIKQSESIEDFMKYMRKWDKSKSHYHWSNYDSYFSRLHELEHFYFVMRSIFSAYDEDASNNLSPDEVESLIINVDWPWKKPALKAAAEQNEAEETELAENLEFFLGPKMSIPKLEFEHFYERVSEKMSEIAKQYKQLSKKVENLSNEPLLARLPFGQRNQEDEDKLRVMNTQLHWFEKELLKFSGVPGVYDVSFSLILVVFFAEACLVSFMVLSSLGGSNPIYISAVTSTLSLVLIYPVFRFHHFKDGLKRALRRMGKREKHAYWLVFLLNVTNVLWCRYMFGPTWMLSYEVGIPMACNTLTNLAVSIVTLWRLNAASRYAFRRDADMLESVEPKCPVDKSVVDGFEVLDILYRRATERKKQSRALIYLVVDFIPCLLLPARFIINLAFPEQVKRWGRSDMVTRWDETAKTYLECYLGPEFPGAAMISLIVTISFGAIVLFQSTYGFHTFLEDETYLPFRRNHRLMQLLLSTTSSVEASVERIPYLPLNDKENLQLFSKITRLLHVHEQRGQLHQASTGFAALLFVDVVLVTSLVVLVYLANVKELSIFLSFCIYFTVYVTALSFRILFKAIDIHQVHVKTVSRLYELATEYGMLDEGAEITQRINNLREELQNNFKPITILGIPATPTLMQVFIGYLVSSFAAIVGSKFMVGS